MQSNLKALSLPIVTLLCVSLSACAIKPASTPVQPAQLPQLPQQARQQPLPAECSPTCLQSWSNKVESLQRRLIVPGSPDSPASK